MAKARSAAQKAALKKAQLASARKRKGRGKSGGRKRKAAKIVVGAAAVSAVGYGAYRSRGKMKRAAYNKAKENPTARKAAVKHLRKNVKKKPGLKMGKKYRMGRPEVRRKRKASR